MEQKHTPAKLPAASISYEINLYPSSTLPEFQFSKRTFREKYLERTEEEKMELTEAGKFVDRLWNETLTKFEEKLKEEPSEEERKKKEENKPFDGQKITFTRHLSSANKSNMIKITPNFYRDHNAAVHPERPKNSLPNAWSAGVIILCKTADNQLIAGSRMGTKLAQFPCGFLDFNHANYKRGELVSPEQLSALVHENAYNEFLEEVVKSPEVIKKMHVLGSISALKKYPCSADKKEQKEKEVENYKSFVVLMETDKTFAEIEEMRKLEQYKPKDKKEIKELSPLSLAEIKEGKNTVKLTDKETSQKIDQGFVAEHPKAIELFRRYMEQEQAKMLVRT